MNLVKYNRPELSRWSPFDRLANIQDELDRFLDMTPFWRDRELFGGWSPALDVWQDNDNLYVRAELPGLKKDDINISLHDGMLSISGERRHEEKVEEGQVFRNERYFGKFHRSVALPTLVDAGKVKAAYEDGILHITLPKAEEAKPKQISIDVK